MKKGSPDKFSTGFLPFKKLLGKEMKTPEEGGEKDKSGEGKGGGICIPMRSFYASDPGIPVPEAVPQDFSRYYQPDWHRRRIVRHYFVYVVLFPAKFRTNPPQKTPRSS